MIQNLSSSVGTSPIFPNAKTFREIIWYRGKNNAQSTFAIWRGPSGEMLSMTFGELYERTGVLSNWISRTFQRGRIAVIGENSISWILVYYSLLNSSSAATLPDPNLAPSDMSNLLQRSKVNCVFLTPSYSHTEQLKSLLPGLPFYTLDPETLQEIYKENKHLSVSYPELAPEDPAVIHYTSGTTGIPKCVLISHHGILSSTRGTDSLHFYENTPKVLPILPLFHSFGRISMDYSLADGRTLCILSDFSHVTEALDFFQPDIVLSVPAMIAPLLASPKISFTRMIVAGAATSASQLAALRARGVIPVNSYGMTETASTITGQLPGKQKDGSVGVPPGNGAWEIKIDTNGEVCVRGGSIMTEYIGDEAATREILRDGWLHTGDLGYIDEDGFLFLTGRCKNLIILANGKNVSPEALENKLQSIPGVKEVIVFASDNKICAEIFAPDCDEKTLRRGITALNRELPTYQRIQKLIFRSNPFNRTPSGKIKRT